MALANFSRGLFLREWWQKRAFGRRFYGRPHARSSTCTTRRALCVPIKLASTTDKRRRQLSLPGRIEATNQKALGKVQMSDSYSLVEVNGTWTLFSNGIAFLVFDSEAAAKRAHEDLEIFIEAGDRPEHSIKDLLSSHGEFDAARAK
jgi:hypothetical protein